MQGGGDGCTPNHELTARARANLDGFWWLAVGVTLVTQLIMQFVGGVIPFVGMIAIIIVAGPFNLGLAMFFLSVVRRQQPSFGMMFEGFRNFGTSLAASLLMSLFVLGWLLLLIIPGYIALISYSMTYFIIADNPDIGPLEAIRTSKAMMRGKKWKYFCLMCRFIVWGLLCLLTCGIGFLWLQPYMMASSAEFYDDLKKV